MADSEKKPELTLPALKSLGDLAGAKPTIVIDSREQLPLTFTRLQSVEGTLYSGDYSILGLEELFSVERKTVADLTASICGDNRARFERELHRLRGFVFKRLLIVGTEEQIFRGQYLSSVTPQAVWATLAAFEVRYLPVVFIPTPQLAARRIESWAFYFSREHIKAANQLLRSVKDVQSEGGPQ
jgi:DNA excision repair protein ERCC-4